MNDFWSSEVDFILDVGVSLEFIGIFLKCSVSRFQYMGITKMMVLCPS